MTDLNTCIICSRFIEKAYERCLIDGKSKFDIRASINELPFAVKNTSRHVCRQCLDKIRKRANLLEQEKKLVAQIKEAYDEGARSFADTDDVGPLNKAPRFSFVRIQDEASSMADRPSFPPCEIQDQERPLAQSTPVKTTSSNHRIPVFVRVEWPSGKVEKQLHPGLESLGKMIVRGTYQQIARAAWSNIQLRKNLELLFLKEVDKECANLCSRKNPSCLRSPKKEDLLDFSFEKQSEELVKRAPLFYSTLVTASVNRKKTSDKTAWITATSMASAVLLRNRSPYMNAIQLMLGMFLYHSNWAVSI